MNFQTSIKTCFNKFAIFSGRASRSEFWFFILFGTIGGIIATIIDVMIFGYTIEENGPIYLIFWTNNDDTFSSSSNKKIT